MATATGRTMHRFAVVLVVALVSCHGNAGDDFDDELYSVMESYRDGSLWTRSRHARSITETPRNESFSDNSLWNDLWYQCRSKPSFSCVKSGVFKYLDKNLESAQDLQVTDHLVFQRNKNNYGDVCENSEDARESCLRYGEEKLKIEKADEGVDKNATSPSEDDEDYDITEGAADGRSVDTLSDVTDILYDKGAQFMMNHDVEWQLPETLFGGGSIRIEPKTFVEEDDGEGTVVKIIFKPPPPPAQVVRGRLLHHLKRLFKKKLMHSFMALMLIIKMIKVKIMFLLPMIVGQSTAKKLLLKVLLFLIPGLAHLFKLCHYYHMEHAKYHHHHHKIKHHHHTVKVPVPVPVPVHHHHHDDGHYPGGGYDYPVPYPPASYPPYPPSNDHEYEYQPSGSNHENTIYKGEYGQYSDNEAALASWGLGSHNYRDAGVLDAKDQPSYSDYSDPSSYYKKTPYGYPDSSYYQNDVSSMAGQKHFYGSKLQFLSHKPTAIGGSSLHQIPDPFYTPILQRIDGIFNQMGYSDEGCRERLVCSMYKAPHRFSPHSNLISNELSRDATELQKPVANNEDVLRFYRYVQAARDGQDQKDCLHIYQACHVNTER